MFHWKVVDSRFEGLWLVALLAAGCVDKATKADAALPDADFEAGSTTSWSDADSAITAAADGGDSDSTRAGSSSQDDVTVLLEDTGEDASLDVTLSTTADGGTAGSSTSVNDIPSDAAVDATAAIDAEIPGCAGQEITSGSHLFFQFDTTNAEWVTSLLWQDSTETLTENLVGYGGGPGCSSPYEFFGQAFAAPEGNGPYPVGGNNLTSVTSCGLDQFIESLPSDCSDAPQIPVTTNYHFYDGTKADQVRITRTIGFGSDTAVSSGVGMRVYTPRPSLNALPHVIIPYGDGDSAGITVVNASSCGGDCFTQVGDSWSGQWFADVNPTTGLAMIVLRDAGVTSSVSLTVNNDSSSGTNVSSFVVLQPTEGWKEPLTETAYLCFVDLTTWPQVERDAAILPSFCGP